MSDDTFILPPSFLALFTEPGSTRRNQSQDFIRERYGFCEDLANLLVDTAKGRHWELGIAESDVLARIHEGLVAGAVPVSAEEAQWVSLRLAELLGWEPLAPSA
jgi:hypothetical protein